MRPIIMMRALRIASRYIFVLIRRAFARPPLAFLYFAGRYRLEETCLIEIAAYADVLSAARRAASGRTPPDESFSRDDDFAIAALRELSRQGRRSWSATLATLAVDDLDSRARYSVYLGLPVLLLPAYRRACFYAPHFYFHIRVPTMSRP